MTHPRDGQHLILGRWQDADGQDAVDAAARAAEAAFPEFAALSRDARAGFLEAIADATTSARAITWTAATTRRCLTASRCRAPTCG